MKTREVIAKVKKFRDHYGFDITDASGLTTKKDCLEALESHKRWLEDSATDARDGVDDFIKELGIGME